MLKAKSNHAMPQYYQCIWKTAIRETQSSLVLAVIKSVILSKTGDTSCLLLFKRNPKELFSKFKLRSR